jgi:zinc protease
MSAALWGPATASQASVPLPDLTHKRLLNDLQVVVASTPYLGDSMVIGVGLGYGAAFDPADKGGLAHLVSRLIGRGSQDRTAKDVQDELKLLGASLESRCDWDGIRFYVKGPSARYERMLLLLYQIVGEAVFSDEEVAAARAEALARIASPGDPRRGSREQFEAALMRGTTFGRPITGSKASLENVHPGDVRYFYRRFFSPNAASLVVVGSAPPAPMLQKAARIWGVWVRKDEVPFTFLPPRMPSSRPVTLVDDATSPAAQFLLGNLWLSRDDPAYAAAAVAARILQERLTRALPTSLVTVAFEPRRMAGPFYVQGQAAADQLGAELEKILQAAEQLRTGTVSAEEVAAAQKQLVEDQRKALGTPEGICDQLLEAEMYRLGTNYLSTYPELIQRVEPDGAHEAAQQWIFPGGVLIYVRGPAAALKPVLEKLGTVTTAS